MASQPERQMQMEVVKHLKTRHPSVRFHSQLDGMYYGNARGARWAGVQAKMLQHSTGFPDMIILRASGEYCALALELKLENPYRKDGKIKASKNDHLISQEDWLKYLRQQGWKAEFVWNLDQAKKIIDTYLQ